MAKILASDNTEHKSLKAANAYEKKLGVTEAALSKIPVENREAVKSAIVAGVVKVVTEPVKRGPRKPKVQA